MHSWINIFQNMKIFQNMGIFHLDSADHVAVETVAVFAGVLSDDVGPVSVVVPVHVTAGLCCGCLGGGEGGGDVVLRSCHLASIR